MFHFRNKTKLLRRRSTRLLKFFPQRCCSALPMKLALSIALLATATLLAGQDQHSASQPGTGVRLFGTVRTRHGDPVVDVDRTALQVMAGGTFASIVKLKDPHPGSYCVVFDLNDEGRWMFELQSTMASAVMNRVVGPTQPGDLFFATHRIEMPMRNLTPAQIRQRIAGANLLRQANALGEPPLYSAMQECIDELARAPANGGPPVMFVFTGQRGPASVKINDIAKRSLEAGVLMYMLHIARSDTANSKTYAVLAKAAVGTGGMAFEITSGKQSDTIAHDIADDFANGYEFCYVPPSQRIAHDNLYPFSVTSTAYKVTTPGAYPDPAGNRACSPQQ